MREKIRHGCVIRCDVEGCRMQFLTYSSPSVARKQVLNDGWARGRGKVIDLPGKVDLCPVHVSLVAAYKMRREAEKIRRKAERSRMRRSDAQQHAAALWAPRQTFAVVRRKGKEGRFQVGFLVDDVPYVAGEGDSFELAFTNAAERVPFITAQLTEVADAAS